MCLYGPERKNSMTFRTFFKRLFRYKKSLIAATVTGGAIAAGVGGDEIVNMVIDLVDVLDTDVHNDVN